METNTLKIAHINYQFEDGQWVATCDQVGLVCYQNQSLEKVKVLVDEGLALIYDDQSFQLVERFGE
jgi:predicted RNase H-like HicB family nuclease